MDRYAVIGNPVDHSISPRIHTWFAAQTGQRLEYGRVLAPLDGFVDVASRFFAAGGRGLNVTVPFKAEAAAWVDELDTLARRADAVNTIKAVDGRRVGFNTDGLGLVRDLQINEGFPLRDARILVIGAGGAASGVVGPILEAKPAELLIGNRTPDRAERLVARFPQAGIRAVAFADLCGPFDLVINATSAGLGGQVPEVDPRVVADALYYDMIYGRATAFTRWAAGHGARKVVDGLGMLVEQAAEAFNIWRGVRPATSDLLATLRAERDTA